MNRRVLIWGNGSVGSGLAVILSRRFDVVLIGPPGCGEGTLLIRTIGSVQDQAAVKYVEAHSHVSDDYNIIAVKAGDLGNVARIMVPLRDAQDSRIPPALCLTNGMGLESQWGSTWNRDIEPAVLTAGFRLKDEGVVETFPGSLLVSPGGTGSLLFGDSILDVCECGDIEAARWAKWLANSIINPIGALTGLRNNQLRENGLEPLIRILFHELAGIVPESLIQRAEREAEGFLDFLLTESGNRCSMLQDMESGSPTEIDFLTGLCSKKPPGSCPAASILTILVKAKASQAFEK